MGDINFMKTNNRVQVVLPKLTEHQMTALNYE